MARNRSGATAPAVKGNIVVGTGTDTSAVLAVGANGTTLVADSAEATGLKWQAASSGGLTKITPTSTANSGGTVSTSDGVVTASGSVSSLSINGVFSSTYVNYMIVYNEITTSGNDQIMNMRLRASGTDNTSAIYKLGSARVAYTGGAPGGYSGGSETAWVFVINSDEIKTGGVINVNSPNVAVLTSYSTIYASGENGGYIAGFHNTATAFDGFTVYPSGGTFSGIFRVYGISN